MEKQEDMRILLFTKKSGIAFVSSCFFIEGMEHGFDKQIPKTAIYKVDLNQEDVKMEKLEIVSFSAIFNPHGIGLFEDTNGDIYLFVVNHRDVHYVEIFQYKDNKLFHKKSVTSELFISPNDVFPISVDSFYITNDHGLNLPKNLQILEEVSGICLSQVVHVNNGIATIVAFRLCFANGIFAGSNNRLYVAESIGKSVAIFTMNKDGSLSFVDRIYTMTGVDNIDVVVEKDRDILYIGCHPKLLSFMYYMMTGVPSPSQVIRVEVSKSNNATIDEIYLDNGYEIAASATGISYKNKYLVGSVADDHIIYCEKK